jgi:SAM-dependent methyltransferase
MERAESSPIGTLEEMLLGHKKRKRAVEDTAGFLPSPLVDPDHTTTAGVCTTAADNQDTSTTKTTVAMGILSIISNKEGDDHGHRYGNFHNYYSFHPVAHRTDLLQFGGGILDRIVVVATTTTTTTWNQHNNNVVPSADNDIDNNNTGRRTFSYLDIGCNEGDLTIKVAQMLHERLSKDCSATPQQPLLHVKGLDLDPILIERAKNKVAAGDALCSSSVQYDFRQIDVLQHGLSATDSSNSSGTCADGKPPLNTLADLITLFSTTMWIHIHGGDDGLRRVLGQICAAAAHFVVLEVQPSKCYGAAATRLRRLGLEPVDVSLDRLQLRANIVEAVEAILAQHGFACVDVVSAATAKNEKDCNVEATTTTSWNRSLRLYQRVSLASSADSTRQLDDA